jgi:hypothetical protein
MASRHSANKIELESVSSTISMEDSRFGQYDLMPASLLPPGVHSKSSAGWRKTIATPLHVLKFGWM